MKIIAQTLTVFLAMVLILISACTESTPIGADLLEQDQADIQYIDTFTIRAKTIREDSVRIFDPNPQAQFFNYLCGNYEDPVFGKAVSDMYIQFRNGNANPPDYDGVTVDSLVLKLEYDTIYGNANDIQHLEVYQIDELIDADTTTHSKQMFNVSSQLLGSKMFRPQVTTSDSLFVLGYTIQDSVTIDKLPPHIRISLTDFTQDLANLLTSFDTTNYVNNAFVESFNGLYVKAVSPTQAMMAFNLSTVVSGMTLYFKTPNGKNAQYEYDIFSSSVKHTNYRHDFSGTPVGSSFDDWNIGDSILYLQGISGPNIEVSIPYAKTLRDQIIVNKAELIFTIASPVDDPVFSPLDQIILTQRNDEGVLSVIQDVLFSLSRNDLGLFGGTVEQTTNANGQMVQTYSLNISGHFQSMIDGDTDPSIILRAFPKQERASRVILYGPGHSQYPTEIKLTYTKLNQ